MTWVRNLLLMILVPGTGVFLIPLWIVYQTQKGIHVVFSAWTLVGVLLILMGIAAVIWVVQVFARYGKGTPVPFDPPKMFVAGGIYRFMRNPMYLGALITILGIAVAFLSWWVILYAGFLFLVLHLYVTLVEEPALRNRFGAPYEEYLKTVPRWIPKRKV